MSELKFELNEAGVKDLLRSKEMEAELIRQATKVKNRCGKGYSVHTGPNRVNVSVRTETQEAARDNLEHNTLLKRLRR